MKRATVALLKSDHTWEERVVETDGANPGNAAVNAEMKVLHSFSFKLPPPYVSVHCIKIFDPEGEPE